MMMNDIPIPPYIKEEQAREKLREYRKLVRDHIQGNIQFHEDEYTEKQAEETVATPDQIVIDFQYMYGVDIDFREE